MACGRSIGLVVGAIGVAVVALADCPAVAQQPPDSTLEQQFDNAFQQMLRDPSNLDNTFRYAELAIRTGDYEAAISALERMLLFNPDLPRVRLELGVLYFRLGSYAISRTYLQRAIEGENVPDDVRGRVAQYLEEIDKRTSRHRFSGSIYGGARWQSNANAGPNRSTITLLDTNAQLGGQFTEKQDWNLFASGNLRYTYDPQLQSGEVLQSDLLVYAAEQFEQGQLDLVFIELKVGPRAQLWPEMIDGLSYRPYAVGQHTRLDDRAYFHGAGVGINMAKQFGPIISGEANIEHVFKDYQQNANNPSLNNQDGSESEVRVDVNFALSPTSAIGLGTSLRKERAQVDLFGNTEFLLTASYTVRYEVPVDIPTDKWTSSLSMTRVWTDYDEADPVISPSGEKRDDKEFRISLLTSIPLTEAWSLIATLQHTTVDSNFKNFTYQNSSASLGASWRF